MEYERLLLIGEEMEWGKNKKNMIDVLGCNVKKWPEPVKSMYGFSSYQKYKSSITNQAKH